MGWIISLIIGGVVGWLASIVMKTNAQMGMIANVLVGIVGFVPGFWVAAALGIAPVGGIVRFLVSLVGAVALIFILRALGIFKKGLKPAGVSRSAATGPPARISSMTLRHFVDDDLDVEAGANARHGVSPHLGAAIFIPQQPDDGLGQVALVIEQYSGDTALHDVDRAAHVPRDDGHANQSKLRGAEAEGLTCTGWVGYGHLGFPQEPPFVSSKNSVEHDVLPGGRAACAFFPARTAVRIVARRNPAGRVQRPRCRAAGPHHVQSCGGDRPGDVSPVPRKDMESFALDEATHVDDVVLRGRWQFGGTGPGNHCVEDVIRLVENGFVPKTFLLLPADAQVPGDAWQPRADFRGPATRKVMRPDDDARLHGMDQRPVGQHLGVPEDHDLLACGPDCNRGLLHVPNDDAADPRRVAACSGHVHRHLMRAGEMRCDEEEHVLGAAYAWVPGIHVAEVRRADASCVQEKRDSGHL